MAMSANTGNPPHQAAGDADAARVGLRAWQMLALAAAGYLLLSLLGGRPGHPLMLPRPLALAVVITAGVAFIGISVVLVALTSRLSLSWQRQLALAGGFGAAFGAARLGHVAAVGDLLLVIGATFMGALASRVVRERNMLVPVAVAAAAVDTWGVYWGFVAKVAEKAPQVVAQFSAAVPVAALVEVPLLKSIGVGDFLFMGLFVAAVYRMHLNVRATLWALFAVFLVVPVVFSIAGVPALPGLPFLGLAVLAANWRHFRFSRAEKFALLYATLAVAALIGAAWAVKQALT